MERRRRTLVKTITFRIIATLITIFTAYYFTGNWAISLELGIIANLIKTLAYYVHERFWNRVDYGRS